MPPRRAARIIGIAGPSGSGKTSLALAVAERLPSGAVVFALDAYYRDQRGVSEEAINVDVPEALERPLIVSHLEALAAGRSIRQPVYDFATHTRERRTRSVEGAAFVIVEGLYTLYWPEVRRLIHTAVFVELDHAECLRRRIARDVRERGRTPAAVTLMYESRVRPMYDRYVHPTRAHAGLVLDGREPIERLRDRLLEALAGSEDAPA